MSEAYFLFQAPITPESVGVFCNHLEFQITDHCERIHLLLNCPGGSMRIALGMMHFLEMIPCEVVTYNLSSCDSAAILLYVAGKKRYCVPEARFWTHPVYKESPIVHTYEELENEMQCLKQDNSAVITALSERTAMPQEQWTLYMTQRRFVSVQESLVMKLTTAVQKPRYIPDSTIKIIA